MNRDISVSKVTRLWLDDRANRQGQGISSSPPLPVQLRGPPSLPSSGCRR